MGEILIGLVVLFFVFETINWFVFVGKMMKFNFQKESLTEKQAKGLHKHITYIYFWLSSPYYYGKLRESYFLVHGSEGVSVETKEAMRKSLNRRWVRGLPKNY
jgi:hypothetical protein